MTVLFVLAPSCVFITLEDRDAQCLLSGECRTAAQGNDSAAADSGATDSGDPHLDSGDTGRDSGDSGDTGAPDSVDTGDAIPENVLAMPSGSFSMGASPQRITAGFSADLPAHTVTLGHAFWIDRTEVTADEFAGSGGDVVATGVNWYQACAFANARSERDGLEKCYPDGDAWLPDADLQTCEGWRLPTEAEWEYAARSGETGEFVGGSPSVTLDDYDQCDPVELAAGNSVGDATWFCDNSRDSAQEVGQLAANLGGGYDFTGNAWEWVADGWTTNSPGATDPLHTDLGSEGYATVRGGSYSNTPLYVRLSSRAAVAAAPAQDVLSTTWDRVGFRLARTCPTDPCP